MWLAKINRKSSLIVISIINGEISISAIVISNVKAVMSGGEENIA